MDNHFNFIGSDTGQWKIISQNTVKGDFIMPKAANLSISNTHSPTLENNIWVLKGFVSNVRYAEKAEKEKLAAIQEGLGRPNATCAALIPIRKDAAWWELAQDERRKIFESQSHHTETGLKYLPQIARKLFHSRDLAQPFDFLTWFEYKPEDAAFFEDLVGNLRATEEWKYVDRELDFRLRKN